VWLIVLLVSVITYFLSQILILAISRYREFAADRGSALITGAPEHLMSALQKISSEMFRDPAARSAGGGGDERVLHHPGEREGLDQQPLHDASAAREAPRSARARSRGRWAARSGSDPSSSVLGLRNVLFGRKQLAGPARERLFAPHDRGVTLQTELGLRTRRRGRRLLQAPFPRAQTTSAPRTTCSSCSTASPPTRAPKLERREDSFGYTWIVVRDAQLEDQVAAVHAVAQGLEEQGLRPQLLAAVFKFEGGKHPVYWIYGYKRGAFWPFVPTGEDHTRDNARGARVEGEARARAPGRTGP
jgi:hypothetical protein